MSVNLELSQTQLGDRKMDNRNVHYMPASIKGDGPAKVDLYFNKEVVVDENGILRNAFRGHPLEGCKFDLPNGYKGLIFRESGTPLDENASRVFKFDGAFSEMRYWNYDKIPSRGDAFRQMWDVARVAETMCAEVSIEEIQKKIEQKARTSKESQ